MTAIALHSNDAEAENLYPGQLAEDGSVYAGKWGMEDVYIEISPLAQDIKLPWSEAADYCERLDTGDHHDWLLPTSEELNYVFQQAQFFILPNIQNASTGRKLWTDDPAEKEVCSASTALATQYNSAQNIDSGKIELRSSKEPNSFICIRFEAPEIS